jgi:hypothetical protein
MLHKKTCTLNTILKQDFTTCNVKNVGQTANVYTKTCTLNTILKQDVTTCNVKNVGQSAKVYTKTVTWTKGTKFIYRCSSTGKHTQHYFTNGKYSCVCGYQATFCTKGCMKRAFKKSGNHHIQHDLFHSNYSQALGKI